MLDVKQSTVTPEATGSSPADPARKTQGVSQIIFG